jgi:hypothetical protein
MPKIYVSKLQLYGSQYTSIYRRGFLPQQFLLRSPRLEQVIQYGEMRGKKNLKKSFVDLNLCRARGETWNSEGDGFTHFGNSKWLVITARHRRRKKIMETKRK